MIGTGARSQELMQAILQLPQEAEIVGVVDAYTGRVERAIERTGGRAKAYANYHELLAQKSIDAVVIATPDHWHRHIILDALAAGKDVYSEKPMTLPQLGRASRSSRRRARPGGSCRWAARA